LEQALVNLVVNARDSVDRAGLITIHTARRTIAEPVPHRHGLLPAGDYLTLTVRDNGTGMTEEVMERLFEPFFTTKAQGEGTGLGLATVHGVVAQAGGTVTVESEPGKGSAFTIHLPVMPHGDTMPTVVSHESDTAGGTATVLLVEDDPMVRRQARRTLADRGYTVLEAGEGTEALALVDAYAGPIDLLVTDVVMPGMSAGTLVASLRARYPALAILYTSGYAADQVSPEVAGEREFLAKPFLPDAFARKVRQLLEEK
jgi:CheY-like chemotaxis protein